MSLYDIVGAERGASAAAIRSAYRRRAKHAHPDGGGSATGFAELAQAVAVLTDERRRKIYDETGRIEEPEPDNKLTDALNRALAAVDSVVAPIVNKGGSIDHIDVVADARVILNTQRRQATANIETLEQSVAFTKRFAARFKAGKGKHNYLGPMILSRLPHAENELAKAKKEYDRLGEAIRILEEHSFEFAALNAAGFGGPLMASRVFG